MTNHPQEGYAQENHQNLYGKNDGDHDRLFPRYTTASAASSGEVVVNGKTIKLWEYSQLETLKLNVLRQRAMAIRDAVGEDNCPPMPSGQHGDTLRWILHMQSELTRQDLKPGRQGAGVPSAVLQEHEARPIEKERPRPQQGERAPFGQRRADPEEVDAARDHYVDLRMQRHEFKEARPLGIGTMREGGEGRRHIYPESNMINGGVSKSDPRGIQTLKHGGEGRRYLGCRDNVGEHRKDMEAEARGESASPRCQEKQEGIRYIGDVHHFVDTGTAVPPVEAPVGGERNRRKHLIPKDNMQSARVSESAEEVRTAGISRKHVGDFSGKRFDHSGQHDQYKSTWKQDPSRLMGTSLIV